MKKLILASLFLLLAGNAFAHAGHVHTYLGHVTMLHDDGSFMMKTTAGEALAIATNANTVWRHANNRIASKSELAVGQRVSVRMMKDDKTAASVKMSGPEKR
jgi:hypothetical protein